MSISVNFECGLFNAHRLNVEDVFLGFINSVNVEVICLFYVNGFNQSMH